MPEPLPSLFITLALAAAPEVVVLDVVPVVLVVVEPDVLLALLVVVVELAVEGVEDDTDVTMNLTYSESYRHQVVKLERSARLAQKLEQGHLRGFRKSTLRRFQRQHEFLHIRHGSRHVQVLDIGERQLQAQFGIVHYRALLLYHFHIGADLGLCHDYATVQCIHFGQAALHFASYVVVDAINQIIYGSKKPDALL
jgi:hypothetical protein